MLINLSNHPIDFWSESQIKSATDVYGEIIDMEFPQINPDSDIDYVVALALDYANKCMEILASSKPDPIKLNGVHVMGEMTFTYQVVMRLRASGVQTLASTTFRQKGEPGNGNGAGNFNFVRFRKYHPD